MYLTYIGLCTYPILDYVPTLYWTMYLPYIGLCTYPILEYVPTLYWTMSLPYIGLCTYPILDYVTTLYWTMYLPYIGLRTYPILVYVPTLYPEVRVCTPRFVRVDFMRIQNALVLLFSELGVITGAKKRNNRWKQVYFPPSFSILIFYSLTIKCVMLTVLEM